MLANTTPSNLSSVLETAEGVQAIQDYLSRYQARSPTPSFPSPSGDNNPEDDTEEPILEQKKEEELQPYDPTEISRLISNNDFQELLRRFLVLGYKEILMARFEIRRQRNIDLSSTLNWSKTGTVKIKDFELLRKHLYQVQMNPFYNSKGTLFDFFF